MYHPVNRASQLETHLNQVRIINQKPIMIDQKLQRVSRMETIVIQTDKEVRETHKDKHHKEIPADKEAREIHKDKRHKEVPAGKDVREIHKGKHHKEVPADKVARETHKDNRHKEILAGKEVRETHRDKFPEIPLKIRPQIKQNNLLKHLSKHCKS